MITETAGVLLWAWVLHLIVDFLFQDEWQATYKVDLTKSAGYVHAGMHTLAMLLVFPPLVAVLVGVIHLFIDTRIPLKWWARIVKVPAGGDIVLHIAIWRDQVLHVAVLAGAVLLAQLLR